MTVAFSADASHPCSVSIVMPVLNEEERIDSALDAVLSLAEVHEVIVVDGGSSDKTVGLARRHERVVVLSAPRGRARQMNTGARAASGEVLLFLHADVTLPDQAVSHVRTALVAPDVVAGAFRTWTVADGKSHFLRGLLHLADVRSRYTRLPYGDQAMFVRAAVFHAVGGYPPIELMEDLALSQRLARVGRIRTVPARVTVSGRRFVARPVFYTAMVNIFPLLYRLGVPPRVLSRFYGHVRG